MVVVGAEGFPVERRVRSCARPKIGLKIVGENEFCRRAGIQPPEDISSSITRSAIFSACIGDYARTISDTFKSGVSSGRCSAPKRHYYAVSGSRADSPGSAELESAPFPLHREISTSERRGQITFDFRIDAEPARIIKLKRSKQKESEQEMPQPMAAPRPWPKVLSQGSALDMTSASQRGSQLVSEALEIDPYLVRRSSIWRTFIWERRTRRSPGLYERAIGLDPDFFEANFNLGNIYHDLGRFQEARECYRTALGLETRSPADAHFYLAITLEKTGRSTEANRMARLQQLSPNGEWVELAREF